MVAALSMSWASKEAMMMAVGGWGSVKPTCFGPPRLRLIEAADFKLKLRKKTRDGALVGFNRWRVVEG